MQSHPIIFLQVVVKYQKCPISPKLSVADLGEGQGGHGPPGPDQQPKNLLEITVLGTTF